MKLKYRRVLTYVFAIAVVSFPLLRPVFTSGTNISSLFYILWCACMLIAYVLHKGNRCRNCGKKLDYKKRSQCPRCKQALDL